MPFKHHFKELQIRWWHVSHFFLDTILAVLQGAWFNPIVVGLGLCCNNSLANQKSWIESVNVTNGGHIVTQQLLDQFMTVTGAGMTIGIVVYMAFLPISTVKIWSIISTASVLTNGPHCPPIVMNPIMMVPFFDTNAISNLNVDTIRVGLIPIFWTLVWTTTNHSGLTGGGWKAAL